MPKIRFHLITPIATYGQKSPKPLMLDGILGYAWAMKNGYLKNPAESSPENLVFPELPLEKIGEKCYAASSAFIPSDSSMVPTKIMRLADWKNAMARYGSPATRYETSVGWQQARQEPYWQLSTPYVDFYYRGNKKAVTELLSIIYNIGFLGGKRAAGFGQIRRIEHFDNSEDWAVWRDDQPTRPIPVSIAGKKDHLTPEWVTYYPPYWAMANSEWCYCPPHSQWLPFTSTEDISNRLDSFFLSKMQKSVSQS